MMHTLRLFVGGCFCIFGCINMHINMRYIHKQKDTTAFCTGYKEKEAER